MSNLFESPTSETPEVDFNALNGTLKLSGRSIHSNPAVFYQPLLNWLDKYGAAPFHNTTLTIDFEYISSPSIEQVSALFNKMTAIAGKGHDVKVIWHYQKDDENMKEMGEDYAAIVNIPFALVEI